MIDIGANLANKAFATDRAEVIDRAREAGVESIIVTGTDIDSSHQAQLLSEKYPGYLYSTAGLHPHDADSFDGHTLRQLELLQQKLNVLAVGETGLDFNRNFSSRENQVKAFSAQMELAGRLQKPLFVHERDAFDTMRGLIADRLPSLGNIVIHCFTGNETALRCYLDMGLHIGITGWICDKKRGRELRDIVKYIPLDRLMIESDAPYLTPHKEKLKTRLSVKHRNEPWTLSYVSKAIADASGQTEESVMRETTLTARRFFGIQENRIRPAKP